MKLGLLLGYSGKVIDLGLDRIKLAESLGFDSVWTAEAYGNDAVSTAAYILAQTEKIKVGTAIMQMPARSPACTAMTAMSLSQLSGGRFILGLGASGPQVSEGWHGVAYGRPVTRIKEYISIVRKIMEREGPVEHKGFHYSLPYDGEDGTGLGKPLKSILQGDTTIPIYTASITPKGLEGSAEVADGVFPVWMNPDRFDVLESGIMTGLEASGRTLADYDIAPFVTCIMGDDLDACRSFIKASMALYIGGMGARKKNFYNDYAKKLGFEEEAVKIQDLYLDGKKDEAAAAVPNDLVDACHLVGPKERIRERLQAWKEADKKHHVSSMLIGAVQPEVLELLAEEML
jgi:F420-dependent oxidoreductase-like protein